MKSWLKMTAGLLLLSGAAMVDETTAQTAPVAVSAAPISAGIDARGDANRGSAGVNETDPIELNKAALRDSDAIIEAARQEVIRDTGKLSDDKTQLEKARTVKDGQATAKAQTGVDSDQAAVKQDRERLQKHLENKIRNDQVLIRMFDEKIKEAGEDADRHTRQMSDDTAKLADARMRYVEDEIELRKTDVANDQTALDADREKLNQRGADKARAILELNTDNRHLDAVVKHLSEESQIPVMDGTGAASKEPVKL